eukprot:Trichotokara_eunicae@DN6301_c0_g1_i17.p1
MVVAMNVWDPHALRRTVRSMEVNGGGQIFIAMASSLVRVQMHVPLKGVVITTHERAHRSTKAGRSNPGYNHQEVMKSALFEEAVDELLTTGCEIKDIICGV